MLKYIVFTVLALFTAAVIWLYLSYRNFNDWLLAGNESITSARRKPLQKNKPLPPQLRRYLEKVVLSRKPADYVSFTQKGIMKLNKEDTDYLNFTARQFISLRSAQFSWLARFTMMGIPVFVCDRLVGDVGELQVRLAKSLPMASIRNNREVTKGEVQRFLAELPWSPQAIRYLDAINWQSKGKNRVAATLALGGVEGSVEFTFSDDGMVHEIYASDRPRNVGNEFIATPWRGRFTEYRKVAGLLVPHHGEVSWILPTGEFVYFKGDLTSYQVF